MTNYGHGKHPNSKKNLIIGDCGQGFNSRTASEANKKSQEIKRKKKEERERLLLLLNSPVSKENVKKIAGDFDIDVTDITVEDLMHAVQIRKATDEANTNAYNAVMDRAYGKPMQQVDNTSSDGSMSPINFDLSNLKKSND